MTPSTVLSASCPHLVIRASAGTGKTFQLSNRYLRLIRRGVPADQILATTFTRKAAGEILDRVLWRLAEAAGADEACARLAEHLGDPPVTREECARMLVQLTRELHRLRVGTLDSFFAQVARGFSLELGLPPGWEIVTDLQDQALRAEAIQLVLEEEQTRDLVALVQLLTKGEAQRGVSQLVHDTVNDLYGVYLDSAPEAWRRLPRGKAPPPDRLAGALETLRSVELPADKRMAAARDADWERAAAGDWDKFIQTGLAKKLAAGETRYQGKEIPAAAQEAYRVLLDQTRAALVNRIVLQTEATWQLLDKFHGYYQRLKLEQGALRFDDVTRALADRLPAAVGQAPGAAPAGPAVAGRVAYRLDGRIEHLLLDEFQDTSLSQWQVVRPFAQQVTASGTDRSFFCVGDVKQAIYGWRGGIAEIFEALPRELGRLEFSSLNKSYRSAPQIIELVNRVFRGMLAHDNLEGREPAVHAWCARFEPHETQQKQLRGYVELVAAPEREEGDGATDATLRYTAQRVAQLVAEAPGFSVGVLTRTNKTVGRLIYLLRDLNVPASEEGGNPLTDSAAVQLVLSCLQLADHPGDSAARFHLQHSPLGDTLQAEGAPWLRFAATVRRQLLEEGYGPCVYRWARQLAPHASRREQSRLEQLVELAFEYQGQASLRPGDFARHIQQLRVSDPTGADVRVMPIHQAKGLEFDIVVLPDLDAPLAGQSDPFVVGRDDSTSPVRFVLRHANAQVRALLPGEVQAMFEADTARSVSESLCVLYVALTRAVHALHMVVPPGGKSLPKSCAGLLRAALTDGHPLGPGELAFHGGDPHWYRNPGRAASVPAAEDHAQPAPAVPAEVRLAAGTGGSRRGLEGVSPSGLEGGGRVLLGKHLAWKQSTGRSFGTLIHAWFEQVKWLEDGAPDRQQLRQVAARLGDACGDIDPEAVAGRFQEMLAHPVIAAALRRSAYQPPRDLPLAQPILEQLAAQPLTLTVHNEQRIAVQLGTQLLSGSIDRLVLLRRGDEVVAADVLDFKTDQVTEGELPEKVEFYRPQINAYRRAVSLIWRLPVERVSARLLFVGPGALCNV